MASPLRPWLALHREIYRGQRKPPSIRPPSRHVGDPDERSGVRLAIPEYGKFPPTDQVHGQLADNLGIPRRYYEEMRATGKLIFWLKKSMLG